jgi:hypothetical protein
MENNIVSLDDLRETKKQESFKKVLDLKASLAILEEALNYLNLNSLEETNSIKKQIKSTIYTIRKQINAQKT